MHSPSREITIREAVAPDIPEILRQRRGMYEDMRYTDAAALDAMLAASAPYLHVAMANGSFHAWLAFDGNVRSRAVP